MQGAVLKEALCRTVEQFTPRLRRKDNQLNGLVYGKTEYIFRFNVLNGYFT